MGFEDKIKWDKKYENTPRLLQDREPSQKLKNIINKVEGKKALDIACGGGRNSIYLAKLDFFVEAVDISKVALESLEKKGYKNILTKVIDLEDYIPNKNSYDIIVMTNYLNRELIPNLTQALKKNGVLFIETFMKHKNNNKPNSNPNFLLEQGELKSFFDDNFEILEYDEFDNEPEELYKMRKQLIIVRKL